jgi:hypothetical protein
MGKQWPLTVDSGTLSCDGSDGVGSVTFETGGKLYAVNGLARQDGYADITPIWAKAGYGLRKNIGPLIDRGLKLC